MSDTTWQPEWRDNNPFVAALVDLVASHDDDDQMVSKIAIRNARRVLGVGR